MTDPEGVRVDRRDGVLVLTLDRPSARNAVIEADFDRMIAELRSASASGVDRAVLLRGAGEYFCAGINLGAPISGGMPELMRKVADLVMTLHSVPVPTVAAVRGPAVGIGFSLALACDMILAADDAKFCMAFGRRGLVLDGGASWLLPRRVSPARASEIAFFGDMIPAAQAVDWGIANRVVPAAELDEVAGVWTYKLAAGARRAQAMTKDLLVGAPSVTLAAALVAETNAQVIASRGREAKEGAKAFAEKRAPHFTDC